MPRQRVGDGARRGGPLRGAVGGGVLVALAGEAGQGPAGNHGGRAGRGQLRVRRRRSRGAPAGGERPVGRLLQGGLGVQGQGQGLGAVAAHEAGPRRGQAALRLHLREDGGEEGRAPRRPARGAAGVPRRRVRPVADALGAAEGGRDAGVAVRLDLPERPGLGGAVLREVRVHGHDVRRGGGPGPLPDVDGAPEPPRGRRAREHGGQRRRWVREERPGRRIWPRCARASSSSSSGPAPHAAEQAPVVARRGRRFCGGENGKSAPPPPPPRCCWLVNGG
mmetsp:Transcript_117921/g.334381  ORF Transcript_117921/g.334381 Transcript_117921/m.334381 type:complete len:278 (-) Transcript_117921:116-949(-)